MTRMHNHAAAAAAAEELQFPLHMMPGVLLHLESIGDKTAVGWSRTELADQQHGYLQ